MERVGWQFDNSYARLPPCFYTRAHPAVMPDPAVVVLNGALGQELGLDLDGLSASGAARLFSGADVPEGADPLAQAYAGHQFGFFNILGDGRALLLGEHKAPAGHRVDVQLKGAGITAYSRRGDGRAALGPMLREYIISEAMHGLGIPTTRALAVVTTGERVYRPGSPPGAILTRIAASHLRVGTFQYAAWLGQPAMLETLLHYAVQRHDPCCAGAENPALCLLQAVQNRQIHLLVQWMRVGFIHGVMNTDNMSIAGETIDYGPCAFLDEYDPNRVFSSIDSEGRYAFGRQPLVARWNLVQLASALLPLIHRQPEQARTQALEVLDRFDGEFSRQWYSMMGGKLGLTQVEAADYPLIDDFLHWMTQRQADYTNSFYQLPQHGGDEDWWQCWQQRVGVDWPAALCRMQSLNPAYIPRNHRVEQALQAAEQGDGGPMRQLLDVLANPYQLRPQWQEYQHPPRPEERIAATFCGT